MEAVVGRYAGTRLGRQELDGELIDDRPDALWTRDDDRGDPRRRRARPGAHRRRRRPAGEFGAVAGCLRHRRGGRARRASPTCSPTRRSPAPARRPGRAGGPGPVPPARAPTRSSSRSTRAARWPPRCCAQCDPAVPVTPVRATRGKYLRAEPVALLYAQGRVHHVGALPGAGGRTLRFRRRTACPPARSPDRLDALVWAVTHLLLGPGRSRGSGASGPAARPGSSARNPSRGDTPEEPPDAQPAHPAGARRRLRAGREGRRARRPSVAFYGDTAPSGPRATDGARPRGLSSATPSSIGRAAGGGGARRRSR